MEITDAIRLMVDTCMQVKPEEDVLVLADDYARPRSIAEAVANASKERGAKVVYMVVPPKRIAGEEPTKTAAAAMRSADVIFGAGERISPVAGHSNVHEELLKAGHRRMYVTIGVSEDYLRKAFSVADFHRMRDLGDKLAKLLDDADSIKLTTPHGTDLTVSIKGRHGSFNHPIVGTQLPDYAEVRVAPLEGTAEGTIVYDGEMDGWGYVLTKPLTLKVRKGRVVDISGNPEDQERLRKIVSTDENSGNIGEFAIGTSHTVPRRLSGTRYDCAILGYIHIGLGRNTLIGGKTISKTHIDGIMTGATVELDGSVILDNGRVMV